MEAQLKLQAAAAAPALTPCHCAVAKTSRPVSFATDLTWSKFMSLVRVAQDHQCSHKWVSQICGLIQSKQAQVDNLLPLRVAQSPAQTARS